jgi:hypothetical protein
VGAGIEGVFLFVAAKEEDGEEDPRRQRQVERAIAMRSLMRKVVHGTVSLSRMSFSKVMAGSTP